MEPPTEPHIDYGGLEPPVKKASQKNKVVKQKKKTNPWIRAAIILLPLFVLGYLFGPYFIYPALTPGKLHGKFLDAAVIPQKDGSTRLWLLADGSFRFRVTTKSGNSRSSEQNCMFCKAVRYIYDPISEKIIRKIESPVQSALAKTHLQYQNGRVWIISEEGSKNGPIIEAFDSETMERVMDTKAFIARYSALSTGLKSVKYDTEENLFVFKTSDGKENIKFDLAKERLFADDTEYKQYMESSPGDTTVYVMSPEPSAKEMKVLYRVSGTKKILVNRDFLPGEVRDAKWLGELGAAASSINDKKYVEGIIYYRDSECVIIIHLTGTGPKAERIMTCIELATGKEKWTAAQEQLFDEMKINESKDSFSKLFFSRDDIFVSRLGNTIALTFAGIGIMGFDFTTGKKLWTIVL